MVHSMTQWG